MHDPVSSPPTSKADQAKPTTSNPFFRITIIAAALFVITILAMIASALGPMSSSSAKDTFDENAGWLLGAELAAILASAFCAMAGDTADEPTGTGNDTTDQATDSTNNNEPVHPAED